MAYTPIMPNMKLTAQDMGGADYMKAIQKGFQGAADVYKPQTAASTLLEKMLKNKHDSIVNQYLPRSEEARIGNTEAETGLIGHQSKNYDQNIQSEIALREAQRGLYGAQAQEAAQKLALPQKVMDMFQNQSFGDQQSSSPEYKPESGMPLYTSNMQNNSGNGYFIQMTHLFFRSAYRLNNWCCSLIN